MEPSNFVFVVLALGVNGVILYSIALWLVMYVSATYRLMKMNAQRTGFILKRQEKKTKKKRADKQRKHSKKKKKHGKARRRSRKAQKHDQ